LPSVSRGSRLLGQAIGIQSTKNPANPRWEKVSPPPIRHATGILGLFLNFVILLIAHLHASRASVHRLPVDSQPILLILPNILHNSHMRTLHSYVIPPHETYKIHNLQLIIGTDKRNPIFTIYTNAQNAEWIDVYFGGTLLEKVPRDKSHPSYRMLLGRLYLAGVKVRALCASFAVDAKTITRWAEALVSDDHAWAAHVIFRMDRNLQRRREITDYVRRRFPGVYPQHKRDYSRILRQEIQERFDCAISGETLRPLFGELKRALRSPACGQPISEIEQIEFEESLNLNCPESPSAERNPIPHSDAALCVKGEQNAECVSVIESAPPPEQVPTGLNHYCGLMIFASLFNQLEHGLAACCDRADSKLLTFWLSCMLLGAVNIERTKLLSRASLKRLGGFRVFTTHRQRSKLARLAKMPAVRQQLLAFNAALVGASSGTVIYFDPHVKEYCGAKKLLKGFLTRIKGTAKALNADYFHTSEGAPVYFEESDNFQEMRERFQALHPRFREAIGATADQAFYFVIDRAIFSGEMFDYFLDPTCRDHLITWEKHYIPGEWAMFADSEALLSHGCYTLHRPRNNATDLETYTFDYLEQPWPKRPAIRRLLVKAVAPGGRTVEVAILCTDEQLPAEDIIHAMFNRWLQENDLKYLINHFGCDELTSYSSTPYAQDSNQVTDRQQPSESFQTLKHKKQALMKTLGKLTRKVATQKKTETQEQKTELVRIYQELQAIEDAAKTVERTESRLDRVVRDNYEYLNLNEKTLMDTCRILARNFFYTALKPYKELYNNYRDDHQMFRNLTRCTGVTWNTGEYLTLMLIPEMHITPNHQRIIEEYLEMVNQQPPIAMDGSNRPIKLLLVNRQNEEQGNKRKKPKPQKAPGGP
jgi:hypothetical protein